MKNDYRRLAIVILAVLVSACTSSKSIADEVATAEPDPQAFCAAMTEPLQLGEVLASDVMGEALAVDFGDAVADLEGVGSIVFLEPDISPTRTAEIEEVLVSSGVATIVDFVDKRRAYEHFLDTIAESEATAGAVTVADMPASFRLAEVAGVSDAFDSVLDELERSDGVFEVLRPEFALSNDPIGVGEVSLYELLVTSWLSPRLTIFMNPSASAAEIETIESDLDALGLVYAFVAKAEAFLEFERMFPDWDSPIDADDMTPSFRIEHHPDVDVDTLSESMRSLPGVFEVAAMSLEGEQVGQRLVNALLERGVVGEALADATLHAPVELRTALPVLVDGAGQVGFDASTRAAHYAQASALRAAVESGCDWTTCICLQSSELDVLRQRLLSAVIADG